MNNTLTQPAEQLSSSQRLLLSLKKARTKLDSLEREKAEPIAIVGMGCRFPGGVTDSESYWQLLSNGVDAITEIPSDRWDTEAYYDPIPNVPGKIYTRCGGFLTEIDQFDPMFFGISPREAEHVDPQQRLLLEVSWEALEQAGIAPDQLRGSQTGIFVGSCSDDYSRFSIYSGDPSRIDAYNSLGNARSITAGRLAYLLDFQGPAIQLDTACSSSVLAVHLACKSLRSRECNLALAGGVNLMLSPEVMIGLCQLNALSQEGRCKTFDAAADGYVRGEGCGVVVLKRLSDAIASEDNILALVRGSAVNHDGRSNGLTAPNGLAQESLLRQALSNAKVEPCQVQYVEAHGTGTSLGDPIEVNALGKVLSQGRSADQPLMIGSVKTNIGHLEGAAGIASLIKVVLSLQHQQIPPHLHLKTLNSHIPWGRLPIKIPQQLTPWATEAEPRRAGVSSFGISGTNVHLVVEEAPQLQSTQPDVDRPLHLLALSAKSEQSLEQITRRYEEYLIANPTLSVGDICSTANVGRSHFSHRLAVMAASTAELREKISAVVVNQAADGTASGIIQNHDCPKIAFLFTGQGSQYWGMGQQLYETQPVFRQTLDQCDLILRQYLEKSLVEVLYSTSVDSTLLDETAYTQPTLFALEYSLFQLWKSWGVEPDVVMGHSVGEYVAACVAGVFSLEDGLKLIAERGRLMQALPANGMMAAVFADVDRVAEAIAPYSDHVAIAALNGPQNTVISGERKAVQKVLEQLESQRIEIFPLRVSHSFHSPLMEAMLPSFTEVLQTIETHSPTVPLIKNLTGSVASEDEALGAAYWCAHIREAVQFSAGLSTLEQMDIDIMLEVGPHPTLTRMGASVLPDWSGLWVSSLRRNQDPWQSLIRAVQQLYVSGVSIDWCGFERAYPRRRLSVPTYSFERQRYWEGNQPNLRHSSHENSAIAHGVASKISTLTSEIGSILSSIKESRIFPDANGHSNKTSLGNHNSSNASSISEPEDNTGAATNSNVKSHTITQEEVLNEVKSLVSEISKVSKDKINVQSRLQEELGFDSLMLVETRQRILLSFPSLREFSLKLLFEHLTVEKLTSSIFKALKDGALEATNDQQDQLDLSLAFPRFRIWAQSFRPGEVVRLEKKLAHKYEESNMFISQIEKLQDGFIAGEIVQDVHHSFFYEHPKDHVPGLYIAEAVRQFGTVLSHLYYDVPLGVAFVLDEMQAQFYKFAETTLPLFIVAQIHDTVHTMGQLEQMQLSTFVIQDEITVAKISGVARFFDPDRYSNLRKESLQADLVTS
ncbi:MAG: beta-ketoacyl synthase N-terminal-like domain-containing protein [Elainellaceae cyanobacterium]